MSNSNGRKPIFFTSDWHIGHKAALTFDERPFRDLEHMHKVLVNNYNAAVLENGICYFLGDIGLCDSGLINSVIRQLNGTKVFIMGNHDPGINALYSMGFDVVMYGAEILIAGELCTLRHCPLKGVWREDTTNMRGSMPGDHWHGESRKKHKLLTCEDFGQFHLAGHIHPRKDKKVSIPNLGRQYDISVVSQNYRPVSISQIESYISKVKPLRDNWRDIPDFADYKVNELGDIKSFKRYPDGKHISPYKDKDGYLCVSLRCDGESKAQKVHRIVANTFISNPDNLPQVNHKNGHKFDNTRPNLQWYTHTENQHHAWDTGLKVSKLTVDEVRDIKKMLDLGHTNIEIAKIYNVDQSTISNIKNNKIHKRV